MELLKVTMACLNPFKYYLLSLKLCPTLWGPVIRPQSKVAKFGQLAKIGEFTVPPMIVIRVHIVLL